VLISTADIEAVREAVGFFEFAFGANEKN